SKASLPVAAGVATVASATGLSSNPIYNIASGLIQNNQLNLGAVSAGLDSAIPSGTLPGPKIWAEGVISYGARDATGSTSASDYNTSGITLGTDVTVNEKVIAGMAIGCAKGTTNIGTDGTQSRSRGTSVAVYGSYQPQGKGFVEGLLGVSTLDYDLTRYVTPISDFAQSNRKGLQLFGSVGGGWEFRDKGRMVSPYGRIDFSTGRLNETTETGAGSYALKYYDQTNSSLQGALGLSGESTHATSFGWAIPRARAEVRKDLQNKSEATISYADQVGGTRYSISPTGTLNSALVLGVGSDFIFRDGWAMGLDYQLTQASATESSYALRLKVIKQLGVKGLPNLLA
ncbi:MAG: autotransporter outer membrane beta-barrel domain-containing protein, partial [Rhodoferax sp.]